MQWTQWRLPARTHSTAPDLSATYRAPCHMDADLIIRNKRRAPSYGIKQMLARKLFVEKTDTHGRSEDVGRECFIQTAAATLNILLYN